MVLTERITERIEALRPLVQVDVGKRGLAELFAATPAELAFACLDFAFVRGPVGIVTGFFIPGADRPETDGPPGAVFLARALTACGIQAALISDPFCHAALAAGLEECGLKVPIHDLPDVPRFSHLIAIERVGAAHDGRCYTMRGLDITDRMQDVEPLFRSARTIGIGDGGNEIGMGKRP